MLNVLTGKVCPGGRLSETYPMMYEDTPSYHYYPGQEKTAEYREGLYVGYRYYESADIPVQFPFGFGLSYTSFSYADIRADKNKITLSVTNTGDMDGAEVVQIYVGVKDSRIFRPAKELKGFQKVYLKAKETKTVAIELDDKAFRYYNCKTGRWETEAGTYLVMAGASVSDIRLTAEVAVEGTTDIIPYTKEELPAYYSADISHVQDSEFEKLLGHPIPDSKWDKNGLLGINDAFCQMYYAKSGLARLVYRILTHIKNQSMKKGNPNLNVLFIYNMPLRGIAKMTGGMVSMKMAESLLEIVNGHFFRGIKNLVKGFFENRKK